MKVNFKQIVLLFMRILMKGAHKGRTPADAGETFNEIICIPSWMFQTSICNLKHLNCMPINLKLK
jgi:hypothetical protein